MPYKADVIKVMIASPSDVAAERDLVREVVHDWNVIHSEDRELVLLPVGWETHAAPAMGERPQAIINKCVLKDCDLLVAIFWTRLGSPTGAAASGTVEEIEEHLGAGKPAMIYFSSAPVAPASIDPGQYKALVKFKESLRDRGLIGEYESLPDFKEKLSRNLAQTVIRAYRDVGDAQTGAAKTSSELPLIGADAQEFLLAATDDPEGAVMRVEFCGGTSIRANDREFGGLTSEVSARVIAKWESAIAELERHDLIHSRNYDRSIFDVTDKGWRLADEFRKGRPA
jgi:hypothetical protein